MRNNVIKLSIILLSVLVIVYFVRDAQLNNQKLEMKHIEVQNTSSELKLLQGKYDILNDKLEEADGNEERIKKLEKEQADLKKEKQRLEGELQAKLERKRLAQQSAQGGNAVQASAVPSGGNCSEWIASAGISDVASATELIRRESNCDPRAVNPSSGACNVAQELPCGKSGCSVGDGACSVKWMNSYVIQRYGSWAGAIAFHNSNNWY